MVNETHAETSDTRSAVAKASQAVSKLLKKKKNSDDKSPEMDMMAFASIMTILLAFFIMLSSFAGKPDEERAKEAIQSFKAALENFGLNRMSLGKSDSIDNLTLVLKKLGVKSNDDNLISVEKNASNLIDENITVEYERKKQQLFFPTKINFEHDGLELTVSSKGYLDSLIKTIKDRDCQVTVCSFTDRGFVPTQEFPTSWQFSAEQAVAVTRYLNTVGRISYKRLTAIGYGEYRPLLGYESSSNTKANNRINIIVSNN